MDVHDFLGTRLRRRSGEGEGKRQTNYINTASNNTENIFSYFFRAGRPCSKNAPKMTSRRLSGTLPGTLWEPPGTPWEAQEAPRATQGDPRSRQERPKSLPESSGKPLRRPLGPQRPSWSHFGAMLVSFWSLRGPIFQPPEVDFFGGVSFEYLF